MADSGLPHVRIMSRRDCGLCRHAVATVAGVAEKGLCTWELVDVDRDKALMVRYGGDVPVILVDGAERFRHHVDVDALVRVLEESRC